MKSLKIKLVFVALFLVSGAAFTQAAYTPLAFTQHAEGGGSVSYVEDLLVLIAENPQADISTITILNSQNTEVYGTDGCYANSCSVDIKFLAAGSYTVVCDLVGGGSFSGEFTK